MRLFFRVSSLRFQQLPCFPRKLPLNKGFQPHLLEMVNMAVCNKRTKYKGIWLYQKIVGMNEQMIELAFLWENPLKTCCQKPGNDFLLCLFFLSGDGFFQLLKNHPFWLQHYFISIQTRTFSCPELASLLSLSFTNVSDNPFSVIRARRCSSSPDSSKFESPAIPEGLLSPNRKLSRWSNSVSTLILS